jgi:hypothetical protein
MSRALVALALGAAGTAGAAGIGFVSGLATTQTPGPYLEARVGDQIRVVGSPIGCRVVRMRQLGGRVVVDCRRAGPLEGTYGTLMSGREALLVEFESRHSARRVVCAVHRRGEPKCR